MPFDVLNTSDAVNLIGTAIQRQERLFFSTPNLNFLVTAQEDEAFRQSVLASGLSLADGMPVVWLSRLQDTPLPERVAGSTVFELLRAGCVLPNLGRPIKVYFFGGPPGVAERASAVLNAEHRCGGGHMVGVGAFCPGFGSVAEMSTPEVIAAINASGADFLVVSLGAKKGQAWIMHNLDRLTVPVVSHLGAVVNFVAGTVERAPLAWQRWGLEWLWRIRQEPALFKRYLKDGFGLVRLILQTRRARKTS